MTFSTYGVLAAVLDGIDSHFDGNTVIIHGAAPGADRYADKWAKAKGKEPLAFPADWELLGKSAGYFRNKKMLDDGQPDVIWAFVDKPLSKSIGTKMMVDLAKISGVPCYVVERVV